MEPGKRKLINSSCSSVGCAYACVMMKYLPLFVRGHRFAMKKDAKPIKSLQENHEFKGISAEDSFRNEKNALSLVHFDCFE